MLIAVVVNETSDCSVRIHEFVCVNSSFIPFMTFFCDEILVCMDMI